MHSETEYIYIAGDYIASLSQLCISVVDLGIGFKHRVNQRFGTSFTSIQALKWALQLYTTTKRQVTGGLGLAILMEFCTKNKGVLQIVTGDAFFQYSHLGNTFQHFNGNFPGTLVTLHINTNDVQDYSLPDAVDVNHIF